VCTALTAEDAIEVRDWDVPPLGPTSLRIAVAATSVNFPDALIVGGESQLGGVLERSGAALRHRR
jgi:NADPH2:quinone reductase